MANTFKNAGVVVGITATTLYTCPALTQAVLHAIYISNVDGTNDDLVTIEVYDSSAMTSFKVGYQLPVPADSTLILDKPINLEAGDELRITAGALNRIEAFTSILEVA